MTDIIDDANEHAAAFLAEAIEARKTFAPSPGHATGRCLCCGLPVEPPRRWCDRDCADDWEAERARAMRTESGR